MPLASWALLTLQDAKEHLSVDGNEFDPVIEGMIESATLACENETDRLLASRTYTNEVYDCEGFYEFWLRNYPTTVANIASISFLTIPVPETWTEYYGSVAGTTNYPIYVAGALGQIVGFRNLGLPWSRQGLRVTYTAGYLAASMPNDIKDACRIALLAIWKQRDKQLAGIVSQSIPGGQTVTYDRATFPDSFCKLLEPYKRWTA